MIFCWDHIRICCSRQDGSPYTVASVERDIWLSFRASHKCILSLDSRKSRPDRKLHENQKIAVENYMTMC